MTEELHNQDFDSVSVEIPQALHDAVARAERVLAFCRQHVFDLRAPLKDLCWNACQALLCVMHDQLEAARLLAEKHPDRPSPIIVTVRPIYEAMLYLLYLLRPDSAEERQALGRMFDQMRAWVTIKAIGESPGGLGAYEGQLSNEELSHHKALLEIVKQTEDQFTPEQKRQAKRGWWNVTWTGRSIAQLAKELEREQEHKFHIPWYGVMSMATHVSPGMIHWSYKPTRSHEEFVQHVSNRTERSAEWLDRGSVTMFSCSLRFLERYGVDLPEEGEALRQELTTIRRSSKDRKQHE